MSKPDLTLRVPKGVRPAMYGKRPFRAVLSVYDSHFESGRPYNFPTLLVGAVDRDDPERPEGTLSWYPERIEFRFQRDDGTHDLTPNIKRAKGFLGRCHSRWSRCYGGEIKAKITSHKLLAKIMDLVSKGQERREKRAGKRPRRADDDLLDMIVSLRWAGVEVWIYSDALRIKREAGKAFHEGKAA